MVSGVSVALAGLDQAGEQLKNHAGRSGGVLISGFDTLARGDYYVMGLNPGGRVDPETHLTIGASLTASRDRSSWNDWAETKPEGARYDEFKSKVRLVLNALGTEPKQTFCTNAIFLRSPSFKQLKFEDRWPFWWDVCWPIHKLFLGIVRPKVVICIGCGSDSPWGLLQQPERAVKGRYALHWKSDREETAAGGKWQPRADLRLDGDIHSCAVLGLPHPTDYGRGDWKRAGDGWALSSAAMAKIAQAREAAGR